MRTRRREKRVECAPFWSYLRGKSALWHERGYTRATERGGSGIFWISATRPGAPRGFDKTRISPDRAGMSESFEANNFTVWVGGAEVAQDGTRGDTRMFPTSNYSPGTLTQVTRLM